MKPTGKPLLYPVAALAALAVAPEILTGANNLLYSPMSYARGAALTLAALSLSLLGHGFLSSWRQSRFIDFLGSPIHSLFIGQLLLFFYIYFRSLVNAHLFFLPVTAIDFVLLAAMGLVLILRRHGTGGAMACLQEAWPRILLTFGLLFLVLVGLCENELPRIYMLSTDPDQHAFFAKQVRRFNTIPYHQYSWGPEGFNYPAGTGVLGFIWSSLSFLDVRDIITISPLLQAYLVLFLITELLFLHNREWMIRAIALVAMFLLFSYLLPYGMNQNFYYLAGTGRLCSIAMVGFAVSLFAFSFVHNGKAVSAIDALLLALLSILTLFYAVALNPINVFYGAFVLAASFFLYCRKSPGLLWFGLLSLLVVPCILLDPYYSDLVFRPSDLNIVQYRHYQKFDLTLAESIRQAGATAGNQLVHLHHFFKFELINSPVYLILFMILLFAAYRFSSGRFSRTAKMLLFLLALLFMLWVPLSSVFYVLFPATEYRLLRPYFEFSRFQYLYVIFFFLFAMVIRQYADRLATPLRLSIALPVVICLLVGLEALVGLTYSHSRRVAVGNELHADDARVLAWIERYYRKSGYDSPCEPGVPRVLLLNQEHLINDEKWLFPAGAARIFPFYNVFPAAFFYFKGEPYYTFDDYHVNVCRRFNQEWLLDRNIRYMFVASDYNGVCIDRFYKILEKNRVLFKQGNAMFVELLEQETEQP